MVQNFLHKGIQKLFEVGDLSGLPSQQIPKIRMILGLLNQVSKPNEMNFPGSDFHQLKGNRKGEYAISVNGNYRITFKFNKKTGDAFDVNYEDYH